MFVLDSRALIKVSLNLQILFQIYANQMMPYRHICAQCMSQIPCYWTKWMQSFNGDNQTSIGAQKVLITWDWRLDIKVLVGFWHSWTKQHWSLYSHQIWWQITALDDHQGQSHYVYWCAPSVCQCWQHYYFQENSYVTLGVVKVLSNVECFFISRIFFRKLPD